MIFKRKQQGQSAENNVKSTAETEQTKKGRMVDLPAPLNIIGNESLPQTLETVKRNDRLAQTIDNLEESVKIGI